MKNDPESIVKNLNAAIRAGNNILDSLGEWEVKKSVDEADISVWKFTVLEFELLQKIDTTIKDFLSYKTITEKQRDLFYLRNIYDLISGYLKYEYNPKK